MSRVMIDKEKKRSQTDYKPINRAIKTYLQNMDETLAINNVAEEFTYSSFFEDKMLLIRSIRKGLPYKLFAMIKDITPFSDEDWAEYLNLSKKTLQRHSHDSDFMFKPIHSEKIIELAEVTNFGKEVFDSSEKFFLWINTPSFALGNIKPAELLKDSYGKELVMDELNRIDQGIFA